MDQDQEIFFIDDIHYIIYGKAVRFLKAGNQKIFLGIKVLYNIYLYIELFIKFTMQTFQYSFTKFQTPPEISLKVHRHIPQTESVLFIFYRTGIHSNVDLIYHIYNV
jgi:hypothetical protein